MNRGITVALGIVVGIALLPARARGEFMVERVLTGLNQPLYVTQAPGDNANLYIVERRSADNSLGGIVRYNRLTQTTSTFLDLAGSVPAGGGMLGLAFHPDFQTNGLFYTNSFSGANVATLGEYKVIAGAPTFQRKILEYTNPADVHPINWIGFQPGATGDARNHLYITTGDGGIQADQAGFLNRGQDASVVNGKVLRINIHPLANDAYPANASKNFAIPANNPFVADNTGKLKEIFQTGFRNPWRAGFDRANGDLYVADVGFNTREEINFAANGASFNQGADFGWAKREGTIQMPEATGGAQGNSVNPIYEIAQPTFRSITGGYVYRGPIAELRGQYIFGDFNSSAIRSFQFDRNTDPATFNGATAGISGATDLTATLNSKIPGGGTIKLVVSFGEDNAGNLYIVGMSNSSAGGSIFNPPLGAGELYVIRPLPADANTDGLVDIQDLAALASRWQQAGNFNVGDFNFDGVVDATDLGILATHWQSGVGAAPLAAALDALGLPGAAVPEPAWAATFLVGMQLYLRRRIRRRR